nr:hypothetical protein OG999_04310 [Streptomyces sp. NBC_00886]
MVHELAPAGDLLKRAIAVAERTPEDCIEQYAFTKRARPPRCATSPNSPPG